MRALRPAATALAAVALLAVSACGSPAPPAERDEASGEIVAAADADVFSLQVGDCLDSADLGAEISSVPVTPCSDPHDAEVYFAYDMPDGDYPGDAAVMADAEQRCEAEFAAFIGIDYLDSEIYLTPITPSQDGWEGMDDREILCLVYDEAGVTGSMAGAAR